MKLLKILVRHFPPGIGLEYMQNGAIKNKMIDIFQLTEFTNVEELADELMKKERLLTKSTRSSLILTLSRLKSKLKDDVEHKFQLHKTMEHILPITNVRFNKEGSKCLTGSFDRTCKIWNTSTGSLSATLEGHTGVVFDVTFNYPFDDKIISASFDRTAIVWDGETGEKLCTLWGHSEEVVVVQYDPNNHVVATGSMDHSGKIFDLQTGVELWVIEDHDDALVSLEFSSDGNCLLSGSFDSNVFLWDARTHSQVAKFSTHEDSISRCIFNYDTSLIATSSIDRMVKLWDRRFLKECFNMEHSDECRQLAVAFSSLVFP
ncbi:WD domain, G-beta repeat [Nesidiocoris tenuis]|uniref:WD domain, G-beta repeat n=1 Tax=Nesidiocoris tenuis TaxID=355587 RepID=A0ABN7AIB3_9HEMI|nr:WD domain, G-beta repeat [Nesidiocoris tenuis]